MLRDPVMYYNYDDSKTKYEFDSNNRLIHTILPYMEEWFKYDENGKLIYSRDNHIQKCELDIKGCIDKNYLYTDYYYTYNEFGSITSTSIIIMPIDELSLRIEYVYYKNGQLKRKTEINPFAGNLRKVIVTEYNEDGTVI